MKYTIPLLLLLLAACGSSDEEMPFDCKKFKEYTVYGIDISKYQPQLKWDKIARDSLRFVFIKATQGLAGKDPYFNNHWKSAKEHGLIRGAYHFFENTDSVGALRQAQNFIESVEIEKGDLPPVLDLERTPFKKQHLKAAKIWLRRVEQEFGIKPILYASQHYYNKYLSHELKDYRVWVAKYSRSKNSLPSPPTINNNQSWTFWQFTDKQRNVFSPRNKGEIDLNAFCCSLGSLKDMTKR